MTDRGEKSPTGGAEARSGLSLDEVAEQLGLHYMTVYRYVRTGRLPARKAGAQWSVDPADLATFARSAASAGSSGSEPDRRAGRPQRSQAERTAAAADRLRSRMVEGDEAGSWQVIEEALVGGLDPDDVLLDVIGGALAAIGTGWQEGLVTVSEEHRATAVATRLIGRLGPRFARRGPARGHVILGAPAGDHHGLPVSILRDLLRSRGCDVVDLGADVPAWSWAEAVDQVPAGGRLIGVGLCVSTPELDGAVVQAIGAIRAATPAPIVLGGSSLGPGSADDWGVDHRTTSARQALEAFGAP